MRAFLHKHGSKKEKIVTLEMALDGPENN